MDSERWQRIETLFDAALDQDPSRWDTFLDDHCRDDPGLRAEVAALLASHTLPPDPPEPAASRAWSGFQRWQGLIIAGSLILVCAAMAAALRVMVSRKNNAVLQTAVAEMDARDSRWNSYVSTIAAAEASIRTRENDDARERLERAPEDLRGWEWRHLVRRLDPSHYTIAAHRRSVTAIAFARDGSFFATSSLDSTVALWRTATGDSIRRAGPFADGVESIAIHPSGSTMAAGLSNGSVLVLEVATGGIRKQLSGGTGAMVTFNGDGTRLAAAFQDGKVTEWRTDTLKPTGSIAAAGALQRVAYSFDDKYLISVDKNGTGALWDMRTRKRIADVTASDRRLLDTGAPIGDSAPELPAGDAVRAIAIDPAGGGFATGDADGSVQVWPRNADGVRTFRIPGDGSAGAAVMHGRLSNDGSLLACVAGGPEVHVWDARSGEPVARIGTGRADTPVCVAFNPEGSHLFAGDRGGNVIVFDPVSRRRMLAFSAHSAAIQSLDVSPDGAILVSAAADSTMKFWDAHTLAPRGELNRLPGAVTTVVFRPGNTFATACSDGTIRFWSAQTGDTLRVLRGHAAPVVDLAFSPDGTQFVSVTASGEVRLWDAGSGRSLGSLASAGARAACFTPDGMRIVIGGVNRILRVVEVESRREVARLHGHTGPVLSLQVSASHGRIVSTSADGSIRFWDAE